MSLTTLPLSTIDRPESRAARVASLVAPGALLALCSAGAVSIAASHTSITAAVHLLVALH